MADASPKRNGAAYSGPETTDLINSWGVGEGECVGEGRKGSKGHFLGLGEGSRMEVGPSAPKLTVALLHPNISS